MLDLTYRLDETLNIDTAYIASPSHLVVLQCTYYIIIRIYIKKISDMKFIRLIFGIEFIYVGFKTIGIPKNGLISLFDE